MEAEAPIEAGRGVEMEEGGDCRVGTVEVEGGAAKVGGRTPGMKGCGGKEG